MYIIADAHCDLLGYLEYDKSPNVHPHNPEARCALPQLQKGHVGLQITAIFTKTEEGSSARGINQSAWFKKILRQETNFVAPFPRHKTFDESFFQKNKTYLIVAIENASSFCSEEETLTEGIENLSKIIENTGRILYISLTHHLENRFGGGDETHIGLKSDGKKLLEYLSGKKIALDFSHASDVLIEDCLNFMDRQNLRIPVMASHSNLRTIHDHPRNLPTALAKEIVNRKGVIGLNWLMKYLGTNTAIAENLKLLVEELGAEKQVCSGADLFPTHMISPQRAYFFPEYQNAKDFPKLMDNLEEFGFCRTQLRRFAHQNLTEFVLQLWQPTPSAQVR